MSQVRSAIKMAGIVQRHAADITAGKAAAAVEAPRTGGIGMKKKTIIGAAVFAAVFATAAVTLRRFAPAIQERAVNKCHQMMGKCQEMFGQKAGSSVDTGCTSAAAPGPEQAAAGEHEPAGAPVG